MGKGLEHLGAWDRQLQGIGVIPLPHVLGPKYERRQRPRNSEEFRIGVSQGDLSHKLRRGRARGKRQAEKRPARHCCVICVIRYTRSRRRRGRWPNPNARDKRGALALMHTTTTTRGKVQVMPHGTCTRPRALQGAPPAAERRKPRSQPPSRAARTPRIIQRPRTTRRQRAGARTDGRKCTRV